MLRNQSPDEKLFAQNFLALTFSTAEHGSARYLLRLFDDRIATTEEVSVAGTDRVHVEHIYPQHPKDSERWARHSEYVCRLGNLTLLDRRLNEQIKNAMFALKKTQAYQSSRLEVTRQLLQYDEWSPQHIELRQSYLLGLAEGMWPQGLI